MPEILFPSKLLSYHFSLLCGRDVCTPASRPHRGSFVRRQGPLLCNRLPWEGILGCRCFCDVGPGGLDRYSGCLLPVVPAHHLCSGTDAREEEVKPKSLVAYLLLCSEQPNSDAHCHWQYPSCPMSTWPSCPRAEGWIKGPLKFSPRPECLRATKEVLIPLLWTFSTKTKWMSPLTKLSLHVSTRELVSKAMWFPIRPVKKKKERELKKFLVCH